MDKLLAVLITVPAAVYFLFVRKQSMNKTLTASRWLILAWTILVLIFVFNPIKYNSFEFSVATASYCLLWLTAFVVGDYAGSSLAVTTINPRSLSGQQFPQGLLILLDRLIVISIMCGFYYGYVKLNSLTSDNLDFVMSDLRGALTTGSESKLSVLAVDIAMCGLVFSLIRVSYAIIANKALSLISLGGVLAYLPVYVFRAGRQGIAIAMIALLVALAASLQASKLHYRHFKRLTLLTVCLFALVASYFTYNTLTRSVRSVTGELSLNTKIAYVQRALDCTIDPEFIVSMQKLDPVGSSLVELFIYYSPQLYGLDFAMKHPFEKHIWGGLQFNYFARIFEKALGEEIFLPRISAWENVFYEHGLFPNFFRTAVMTTYMDFGPVFDMLFLFFCGFFAGRVRKAAVTTNSPFFIAFQGLICSGAFMTTIYSPFCEIGWAYPWLLFMLLYLVYFSNFKKIIMQRNIYVSNQSIILNSTEEKR